MKIYKITKPGTNEVYIGQTKLKLERRLQYHFGQVKYYPHILLYKWLDKSCLIELIEEFESIKKDLIKEMQYVEEFENLGFELINTRKGQLILNANYSKAMNAKHSKTRNPDYTRWAGRIAYAAKKLGLTSKQYRKQYSIPNYAGEKKL